MKANPRKLSGDAVDLQKMSDHHIRLVINNDTVQWSSRCFEKAPSISKLENLRQSPCPSTWTKRLLLLPHTQRRMTKYGLGGAENQRLPLTLHIARWLSTLDIYFSGAAALS